jgi:phosphotransacetylase
VSYYQTIYRRKDDTRRIAAELIAAGEFHGLVQGKFGTGNHNLTFAANYDIIDQRPKFRETKPSPYNPAPN